MKTFKFHLAYFFIFIFLFFTGFDSLLIWKRTFLENKSYDNFQYIHYFASIIGGWILGILFFKRMIPKYPLDFMLQSSLLIAALSTWSQFRVISQGNSDLFSINVFLNLVFNIAMGFLIYNLKFILDKREEIKYAAQTTIVIALCTAISFILSVIFVRNNFQYYFLITSLTYLAGHYYFRNFNFNEFLNMKGNKYKPQTGIIAGALFLCLCILLIKSNYVSMGDSLFDDSGFLLVFVFVFLTFRPNIGKAIVFCFLSIIFIYSRLF